VRDDAKLEQAKELRRRSTRAEKLLWEVLRAKRLEGFKFVRQAPIGPFVVDFACRSRRLIIEVDGATHSTDDEIASDAKRSIYLEKVGYRIIRVQNNEVKEGMDGVIADIIAALRSRID
jgi:very-short-patch-repair endonuclease